MRCTASATLCAEVVAAGGDYLVLVDGNQPTLQADIAQLFAPPHRRGPAMRAWTIEETRARIVEKGHGRLEVREIGCRRNWPTM